MRSNSVKQTSVVPGTTNQVIMYWIHFLMERHIAVFLGLVTVVLYLVSWGVVWTPIHPAHHTPVRHVAWEALMVRSRLYY